jgi:hypothetical protein
MTIASSMECNQIFWVVGALERLATLGMLEEPPLKVSQDAIDAFISLDEVRDYLFQDNSTLKEIVSELVYDFNRTKDSNVIDGLTHLLIDYKDNRERIIKYALSCAYNEN